MSKLNCRHKFKTVKTERQIINHERFGPCRREHRKCSLCDETIIDHLLVEADGSSPLTPFFSPEAK